MFRSRRFWPFVVFAACALPAMGWSGFIAQGQVADPGRTAPRGAPRAASGTSPRITSPAETQYTLAASYYEQRQWRQAADEFHRFVVEYASDTQAPDAMFYEGEALMQLQDFAKAQAAFGELLKTNPPEATARRALFRQGEALFLGGEQAASAERLNEFVARYADDPMAAYAKPYLADIEASKGDHAKARELYSAALKEFPNGALADNCRMGLAKSLAAAGEREEAARFFDFLIKKQGPFAADALLGRMQVAFAAGQYDEVEPFALEFERSFADSPLAGAVARVRGKSQLKRGEYAAAVTTFESVATAADRKPLEVAGDAYYLAVAHLGQEEYEKARDVAGAVDLTGLPETVAGELLSAKGAALAGLKEYPEAAADLAKSLELHPDSPDADRRRAQLAVSLTSAGELDRAEEALMTMAESAKDRQLFADAARHFAQTALDQGDSARAQKWFERLEPNPDASSDETASDTTESDETEDTEELAGASPPTGSADEVTDLSGLAWSQWKNDEFQKAAASFGRLVDEHGDHELASEAALMRAKSLEKLGQNEEALNAYQAVMENYSEATEYPEAMLSGALLIAGGAAADSKQTAIDLLGQLIDKFPEFRRLDAALYERAWLLDETGDAAEAEQMFGKLSAEHPKSEYWADATYRQAERLARAKNHAAAKAALAKLAGAECDDEIKAHALFLESQIAAAEERWKEVAAPLDEIVAHWPEHALAPSAKYWIAESKFQSQDYAAAEANFAALAKTAFEAPAAIANETWLPMVSLRRAQLFARRKKWDEAYEIAAAMPEQFPDFRQLYEVDYLVGRYLVKQTEFEKAREAFQRAAESPEGGRTETAAMSQWMIGESFFHQKLYDKAIREYDVVVASYKWPKWQAAALLQSGKCCELKNEAVEAERRYRWLLKDYPEPPFSDEAESRLKQIKAANPKEANKQAATKANKL